MIILEISEIIIYFPWKDKLRVSRCFITSVKHIKSCKNLVLYN